MWLSNEQCQKVVEEVWIAGMGENLVTRIDMCAKSLKQWSSNTFGDIRKKIKRAEKNLFKAQRCAPDDHLIKTCNEIPNELDNLHYLQESYWFMRARANELKDGDKNIRYFHHKASSRRRRNTITN